MKILAGQETSLLRRRVEVLRVGTRTSGQLDEPLDHVDASEEDGLIIDYW